MSYSRGKLIGIGTTSQVYDTIANNYINKRVY